MTDNKKLEELEEFCKRFNGLMLSGQFCDNRGVITDRGEFKSVGKTLLDLITAYRESVKDVARLEKSNNMLSDQRCDAVEAADDLLESQTKDRATIQRLLDGMRQFLQKVSSAESGMSTASTCIEQRLKVLSETEKAFHELHTELSEEYKEEIE